MFKPMLAASLPVDCDLSSLPYPLLASRKLDGVRAIVWQGKVYSRNHELIPNVHVQNLFGVHALNGADGELIVGSPTAPDVFRKTMSGVMKREGKPDVQYFMFDEYDRTTGFDQRGLVASRMTVAVRRPLVWVDQEEVETETELRDFETRALAEGYEGVMLRHPDGGYKEGRSTLKQFWLVKLKRFKDAEAIVIDAEELMHNDNVKAAGKARKQTLKENLRGAGVLGNLIVRDTKTKVEFSIGSGFNADDRKKLWDLYNLAPEDGLLGRTVKYKYFPTGSKTKPRFPVFLGFRDRRDV